MVIVDTYTLSVAQTVFHGNLSIGSLRFMGLVSPQTGDAEKHLVVLSDSLGGVQMLSIMENLQEEREGGSGLPKSSSQLELAVWEERVCEGQVILAMAICGNIIAFVLESHCKFRLLDTGATIGEISFLDTLFCENIDSVQSHASGCMFLDRAEHRDILSTEESSEMREKQFAVWNDRGGLIMFLVSYSKDGFSCEPLCEISVDSRPRDLRLSNSFAQLNSLILSVESLCLIFEIN